MSVHSCGPNCQKPLCVANRRIEELETEQKSFNTFWACKMHGNHASLRCAICDENKLVELQAKIDELEEALNQENK